MRDISSSRFRALATRPGCFNRTGTLTLYTLQQNEQLSEQNERFHQQQQLIEQLLAANKIQQTQIAALTTEISHEID